MFELKKTITLSAALLMVSSMSALAEGKPPSFGGFNEVLGIEPKSEIQTAPTVAPVDASANQSEFEGEAERYSVTAPAKSEDNDSESLAPVSADSYEEPKLKTPDPDSQAFQDLRKKMMAAKGGAGVETKATETKATGKSIHDLTRQELAEMVKEKQEARIKDRMQSVFTSNRALSLDSGENRIAPISLDNFNRFVTPFDDPKVYSTCPETECKSFVERNVVFFATADKKPRGLFISPSDDPSVSISLTVKPDALINPQEYQIEIKDYVPESGQDPEADPRAATDFEGMGQSKYMVWIRETFNILARGEVPPGYSVGDADASMGCQFEGLDTKPGQVLNGSRYRIDVYKVSNPAKYVQQVTESSCFEDGVKFVFTLPNPKLSPGDSLELFVMRTKPQKRFNLRPKLVGNR